MAESTTSKPITELKVTAHLMRLETGVFCIVQTPGTHHSPDAAGLPGVRVTLPPNVTEGVTVASFRPDGWLSGATDAAVVRVTAPAAQLLVTIYQNIGSTDPAPRLQVIRLNEDTTQPAAAARPAAPAAGGAPAQPRARPEVVAHVQSRGDVGVKLGEWIGERGSKRWIEGFAIAPQGAIVPADIEYQAVLGRGWLSPWSEGGSLCGSRGMSLPILGLRVRLKGDAAQRNTISYEATFVDGTKASAAAAGEACESESLSPLEAFCITVSPTAAATAKGDVAKTGAGTGAMAGNKPAGARAGAGGMGAGQRAAGKAPAAKAPPPRKPR